VLSGGFKMDEAVFFTDVSETFEDGDRLLYGQQGTVVGPGDSKDEIEVLFPGNKTTVGCDLTTLSRSPPPPLPGGLSAGSTVHYGGASENDPLHGKQGEVVGPGRSDAQVSVLFAGTAGAVSCYVTQLRCSTQARATLPLPLPAPPPLPPPPSQAAEQLPQDAQQLPQDAREPLPSPRCTCLCWYRTARRPKGPQAIDQLAEASMAKKRNTAASPEPTKSPARRFSTSLSKLVEHGIPARRQGRFSKQTSSLELLPGMRPKKSVRFGSKDLEDDDALVQTL